MRRVFTDRLRSGSLTLSADESHHLRDVLRLAVGESIELFDAAGRCAEARIAAVDRAGVTVLVGSIQAGVVANRLTVCVASAVPKGDRADWLVEKLSEIGVARWVPLRTKRSVVHPDGTAKYERWRRHAIESAKQSRRVGVMSIDALTTLDALLADPSFSDGLRVLLSTRADAPPLLDVLTTAHARPTWLMIGPEGDWTDDEVRRLVTDGGALEASLTSTILRTETAAMVAAGIAASLRPVDPR